VTTATTVSTLTVPATKSRVRSSAIASPAGARYLTRLNVTSGAATLTSAFFIVRF
jgi:hypothetical protein